MECTSLYFGVERSDLTWSTTACVSLSISEWSLSAFLMSLVFSCVLTLFRPAVWVVIRFRWVGLGISFSEDCFFGELSLFRGDGLRGNFHVLEYPLSMGFSFFSVSWERNVMPLLRLNLANWLGISFGVVFSFWGRMGVEWSELRASIGFVGRVTWCSSGNNSSTGVESDGVSCVSGTIGTAIDVFLVKSCMATTDDLHPFTVWLREISLDGVGVAMGILDWADGLMDWMVHVSFDRKKSSCLWRVGKISGVKLKRMHKSVLRSDK